MPGGYDKHQRVIPVRANPEGAVHYEPDPVAVMLTLRVRRPDLDMQQQGWALAWTLNAVYCFWIETLTEGTRARSGWLPPADVTRI